MSKTMFERYGGFAKISKVVMAFYDKALDSDVIGHYFENTDMAVQIDHQTKFIASVMGGPASYTDDALHRLHEHLGINQEEFDEMAMLLEETLEDFDFKQDDIDEVIGSIRSRSRHIITA